VWNGTLRRQIKGQTRLELAKSKPDKRLMTIRNGVIAFVVLIVLVVGGYGLFRSTAIDVSGEFVEGTHYRVIDGTVVPTVGPINVTEFFSYGCVHCRNFDPIVNDWLHNVPKGTSFDRNPVSFSPEWSLLAQSYFALQSVNALDDNHDRIFKAIHDNHKQFLTADMVADFVDGHGVTRAAFLTAFNSPGVAHAMADAAKRERALRVNSVPYLTVADHYAVNMDTVPRKKAFDVVNFLVAKTLAERPAKAGAP
jgi:thiol:disulfide interchange protein DsbA